MTFRFEGPRSLLLLVFVGLATGCSPDLGPSATTMRCEPYGDPDLLPGRPSQYDSVSLVVDDELAVKVCYSRPVARGRAIFGELVPYDTLWRTGANEATTVHLAQDAILAGVPLSAGQYTLYTVPNPTQWQLVMNATSGQWGLTRDEMGADGVQYYNRYTDEVRRKELDRVPISVGEVEYHDTLTMSIHSLSPAVHELRVDWATTRLTLPLQLLRRPLRPGA